MIVWLALGSSVTMVLVLAMVTRYYRAKWLKMHQSSVGADKIVFDEEDVVFDEDDDNRRNNSNSSASDEFDHMVPYKDQIEHFLCATRELRKPRKQQQKYNISPYQSRFSH